MSLYDNGLRQKLLELKKGDHLCCLYDTEDEHRHLLTPYIRQGLNRHQKVIYITDAHTADQVLGYLEDDGIKVEKPLNSGQLTLMTASDSYLKDGEFDPDRMIRMLDSEAKKAIDEGYSALRVTGEMSWALRNCPGAGRLIEYEAKLNNFIPGQPVVALCQYDRRRFDAGILRHVLRTHPIAVIGREVYENFYFIPPGELDKKPEPEAELEHWEKNLERKKRQTEALLHSDSIHIMMSEISSDLVTANTENVDEKINRFLEKVGTFFRADRCYIVSFSSDYRTVTGTYEWDAEAVGSRMEHQVDVAVEDVPWWAQRTLDGKTAKIDKTGESCPEVSPKEREILLHDTASLFTVPTIADDGRVTGAVCFDASNENKRWRDVDRNAIKILANNIAGVRNKITAEMQCEQYRKEIHGGHECENIVSRNSTMQQLFSILPDIAASDASVIIEGETGTGKELFAAAIHNMSGRSGGPFVSVNCGALPEKLVESELFGYKAGAFTDAKKDKPGRFALAEGGTIFLDEIGELPQEAQVKLLHALQDGTYAPVGGVGREKADVRIIAATNKNLMDEVASDRFREDLYYRLKVMRLELPPLRERKEDIPLLVKHYIERRNLLEDRQIEGVTNEAMAVLLDYDYPGNVRELENILQHGFVLCSGNEIETRHLPTELRGATPKTDSPTRQFNGQAGLETIEQMERYMIERALMRHGGNKTASARELGIGKRTLYRKLKKYGLTE